MKLMTAKGVHRIECLEANKLIKSNEARGIRHLKSKLKLKQKERQEMWTLKSDPEDDGTVIRRNIRNRAPNDTASHASN
jgi:hypothetical protein